MPTPGIFLLYSMYIYVFSHSYLSRHLHPVSKKSARGYFSHNNSDRFFAKHNGRTQLKMSKYAIHCNLNVYMYA